MKVDSFNPPYYKPDVNKLKLRSESLTSFEPDKSNYRTFFESFEPNKISSKMFELQDSLYSNKRNYLRQFDSSRTTFVAIEIKLQNSFFLKRDIYLSGTTIWYQDDEVVGKNNFNLDIKEDWQIIEFVQSWGTPVPGFWKNGNCKVEIFLDDHLLTSNKFLLGDCEIIELDENPYQWLDNSNKQNTSQPKNVQLFDKQTVDSFSPFLFSNELNDFIGLKNVKQSLLDFTTYLNFVQERKQKGINVQENLTPHCIFLGNPGTGKTKIARILGKFYKSIGLLENGHVIEVDRSALVGEFIGATAQKTEQVIAQAIGGILFIDEAYSLKPSNDLKDFGQEAIEIILKRMEDYRGKFIVIVAGYPSLMNAFMNSNPGLKSRFTHTFVFEDYSAEELAEIYKQFASKEKYILSDDASEELINSLELVISRADKSFGNARFIRNIFHETKIQLSKRYQLLNYEERNYSALSTIIRKDIIRAFNVYNNQAQNIRFNNKKIEKYLSDMNDLVGLDDVKLSVNKFLSSAKVDNLKKINGISSSSKNLNSIFIAQPGSGTSTIAKLLGKILKELNLIEFGNVIEIDSSLFYGMNNIESYFVIDKLFQESGGNIILINDAINTLRTKNDFSDSLLQYFLKKLYLNQNKVSAILYSTREEIQELIQSFPVIENQFPNIFNFQEYSNRQLLEIGWKICKKKNYILDEGAWQLLYEIICAARAEVTKNFYNARTVNEILNQAIAAQENRILNFTNLNESDLMTLTYQDFEVLLTDRD